MGRLAEVSLRNRALIALVTVFVMVFGVITTTQLKQELIPSISFPVAVVSTSYPGAAPQVVADSVTVPVEQAVAGVPGIEEFTSTSSTGSSQLTIEMQYGTDMDAAQQRLEAAVSRIRSTLPEEADTTVGTGSIDDFPVVQLAVTSDGDQGVLADRLEAIAVPDLQRIDGVRSVAVDGAPDPQIQVDLDLDEVSEAGLTVSDVRGSLQAAGLVSSAGSIDIDDQTLSVNVGNRLQSAADVADLEVLTPDGENTTIGDLARVREATAPETSISRTNGEPSLSLSITKTPEGNTVEVSEAVAAELGDLADRLGDDTRFSTVFDQAPFITQSIEDLLTEGGLGLLMAVLVILVFLLSLTSTVVTAISIPVSVLVTMIGLRVTDYSLNILTLGALTIAVGRIVDDSIVVIENIKRHLSYGEPKLPAITTAVREVATAITAATITTVAVFLPISLVGGQVGELFRPFGLTVTIALLASLLVSLTIVPVLAYWFLRPPSGRVEAEQVRREAERREQRNPLQRGYVPIIRAATRHPVVTIVLALLVLGGSGALAGGLKTDFLGSSGQNTLTVSQEFSPGLSLDTQGDRAAEVEDALQQVDGVEVVQTTIGGQGFESAFTGGGSNTASFTVTTDAEADQDRILADAQQRLDALTGVGEVTASADAGFGTSSEIEVIITAPDREILERAAADVESRMADVDTVGNVSSSIAEAQPIVQVDVDSTEAAAYGLSTSQVSDELAGVLAPTQVGTIESSGDDQDVVLKLQDPPAGLKQLRALEIDVPTAAGGATTAQQPAPGGDLPGGQPVPGQQTVPGQEPAPEQSVPGQQPDPGQQPQPGAAGQLPETVELSEIADISRTDVAPTISRRDGQQTATVTMTRTGDNLGQVNADVTAALDDLRLPSGAQTELGGVTADQNEAFTQLGLALLVAIAIVYVVMVATFKSLLQPLILLVSIPFAAVGALIALVITDTPLGVPSMIGLLMLVGIVVTNAIVLIDLVNHYRAAGATVDDALIDGARRRLRPILMTAVATIFALTPMALGVTGGGVFISQPLAIVVIGGMVSSTALTLILVPVLYRLFEGRRERQAGAGEAVRPDAADEGAPSDAIATPAPQTSGEDEDRTADQPDPRPAAARGTGRRGPLQRIRGLRRRADRLRRWP